MIKRSMTQTKGRLHISLHDHVAVFYRGRVGAWRLMSFLAEGLERGDRCHVLAPRRAQGEILERLRVLLGAVEPHFRSRNFRLFDGFSDLAEMVTLTRRVFENAEHDRAPALRWIEDGTWPHARGVPMDRFFECHALLNYQVKRFSAVALCAYDLEQFEPRDLFSSIAVHRHLIIGNTSVRDNPFYIPAEKYISLSPGERRHDLLNFYRELGFEMEKLLDAIVGFGRLQGSSSGEA